MLTFGARKFRPGWGASIATAVALGITLSLGNWQVRRAEEKLALQERLDSRARDGALEVTPRRLEAKDVQYARVSAHGIFLARYTILLDNRVHNGVVGYDVVSPLRIDGGDMCVLVNRGWIAAGPRRDVLPNFRTPAGLQSLEGIADVAGRGYLELGEDRAAESKPGAAVEPVWQHLKLERYAQLTGLAVQPFFIRQISASDDGLVRVWERPDRGVDINRGYAFQWYSFAALILILYVVLNLRNVDKPPPRQD